MKRISKLALCIALNITLCGLAFSQKYNITDLGVLSGETSSIGNWVNSAGHVAGCTDTSGGATLPCSGNTDGQHATLWTRGGGLLDLGALQGANISQAYGINDANTVVGYSFTESGTIHAFKWKRKSGMVDLLTLAGGTTSTAAAVNAKGVIVGASDYTGSGGAHHAVVWRKNGAIQDLGTLPASHGAQALGNNNHNQVSGVCTIIPGVEFHAFLWTEARQMVDLGTFPGGTGSYGGYVNDSGIVAGGSDSAKHPGISHCAYWDKDLKIHDAGTLSRSGNCGFGQIDDLGRAVGAAFTSTGASHAILWTKSTGLLDLNNLIPKNSGWVLATSGSINKKGQITGYGTFNGENHAFLMSPSK